MKSRTAVPRIAGLLAIALISSVGPASSVLSQSPRVSLAQNGDVFNNNTRGGLPGEPADRGGDAECRRTSPPLGTTSTPVILTSRQESELLRQAAREGGSMACQTCGNDLNICWRLQGGVEQKAYPDPYPPPRYVAPTVPQSSRYQGGTGRNGGQPGQGPGGNQGRPLRGSLRQQARDVGAGSFALLGAKAGSPCTYSGSRSVGLPGGKRAETIFICIAGDHADGDFVAGAIQSADGRKKFFTAIAGRFYSSGGLRFDISSLNGKSWSPQSYNRSVTLYPPQ
jgi:hypothetical protein